LREKREWGGAGRSREGQGGAGSGVERKEERKSYYLLKVSVL